MKKIVLMLLTVGLVFSASAQIHGGGRGSVRIIAPRVTIIGGYAPFTGYRYGYAYNPYFGYNPWCNSRMYHPERSIKLELQIEDINNDYQDRIWSAKHAKDLSRSDRRTKVHELKHERDSAIIDAKRNDYKTAYKS